MSWTDERVAQLTKLWDEGRPAGEIAKALGVTRNAVIGKAHRLGLSRRPSPLGGGARGGEADAAAGKSPGGRKKAPKKKAEEPPKLVTLLELTERICRWPIGDPHDADFHFCGQPARPDQPYCDTHCRQAYQSSSRSRSSDSSARSNG